ncbi:MAG: hypothetical protein NTW32_22250 [Chloroflexi bacterium]|nr:hypothetical protein [Chloroflexota bacterium]
MPFYAHSTAAYFLAFDQETRPVARLACLNNSRYNEYNHEATAFFYLFESFNQPEASTYLFEAAFAWARDQGLSKIIGPKGFSALDGLGLLSDGFEHRPALGIPYNPDWYPDLVEQAGFTMTTEILSGFVEQGFFMDSKIDLISKRVQERRGLQIAEFRKRSDLRKLQTQLRELYNNAIQGTNGNYPISEQEAKSMADQLIRFADPKLIKIVMKDDRPVGFLFAYPDISEALQRTKGQLFPFGWLDILISLRTTKVININGAGMIEEYRGSGGTAILFSELRKSCQNTHYTLAEIVQVGADNQRMLKELSSLGITFHKKHRMYSRLI